MAKVILVKAYEESGGDYHPSYMTLECDAIDESELEDISKLMKNHFISRWVEDPDLSDPEKWEYGDAALLEYRPFVVRPIRVVKSWELVRTNVGS